MAKYEIDVPSTSRANNGFLVEREDGVNPHSATEVSCAKQKKTRRCSRSARTKLCFQEKNKPSTSNTAVISHVFESRKMSRPAKTTAVMSKTAPAIIMTSESDSVRNIFLV